MNRSHPTRPGVLLEDDDRHLESLESGCEGDAALPPLALPTSHAYSKKGPTATPENPARPQLPPASWTMMVGVRPRSRGVIHLAAVGSRCPGEDRRELPGRSLRT